MMDQRFWKLFAIKSTRGSDQRLHWKVMCVTDARPNLGSILLVQQYPCRWNAEGVENGEN